MKYDARKLSTEEKAKLRREAVLKVLGGQPIKEVTQFYGLGEKTIFKWLKKAREQGLDALAPVPRSGRNRTLNKSEESMLRKWLLLHPPSYFGFDASMWNSVIVKDFIKSKLDADLSVSSVHRLLHRLDIAPKREKATRERDDISLSQPWDKIGYSGIYKLARKHTAKIFWLSEKHFTPEELLNSVGQKSEDDHPNEASASSNVGMQASDGMHTSATVPDRTKLRFLCLASGSGGFRFGGMSPHSFEVDIAKFLKQFVNEYKEKVFIFVRPSVLDHDSDLKNLLRQYTGEVTIIETCDPPPQALETEDNDMIPAPSSEYVVFGE